MKKAFLIAMAGALVLCASCNKEPGLRDGASDAQVIVDIQGARLMSPETKADDAGEYQTENEKKVAQYDLAVYDAGGVLEWHKHYTDDRTARRQVVTGLTEGKKTIAVIANMDMEMPATLAALQGMASDLRDNSRDNFVMSGFAEAMASANPEAVTIRLQRICAKFVLDGVIRTEWDGDAPLSFDIETVYVGNAASGSNFLYNGTAGPTVNLRSSFDLTTDPVYADMTVAQKSTWTPGRQFNNGVVLYAYPNSDGARTAVMIKAKYEGEVTYYPLKIDQDIRNNTLYRIGDITITCQGCDNPWDDFTKVKVNFDIEIIDWDYNEIYPEFEF